MSSDPPTERKCSRCPNKYQLDSFPLSINGTKKLSYCRDCQIKVTASNLANAKKLKKAENDATHTRGPAKPLSRQELSLDAFLKEIQMHCNEKHPISLDCVVIITPLGLNTMLNRKESADQLRDCIQAALPWKFSA